MSYGKFQRCSLSEGANPNFYCALQVPTLRLGICMCLHALVVRKIALSYNVWAKVPTFGTFPPQRRVYKLCFPTRTTTQRAYSQHRDKYANLLKHL